MISETIRAKWREMRAAYPVLQTWTLTVSYRAKRRLGLCDYFTRTISLSSWLLENDHPEVMDTLLHECAHVLAGRAALGHGLVWRSWAVRLGAKPRSCARLAGTGLKQTSRAWVAVCPRCGYTFTKFRIRPWYQTAWKCAKCTKTDENGRMDSVFFRWTRKMVEKVY